MKLTSKYAKRSFFALCVALSAASSIAWEEGSQVENRVTALSLQETSGASLLHIGVKAEPTFSVYSLKEPARLVVEILDCQSSDGVAPLSVRNGVIDSASVAVSRDNDVSACRVILTFDKHEAAYSVQTSDKQISLKLDAARRQIALDPAQVDKERAQLVAQRDAAAAQALAAAKERDNALAASKLSQGELSRAQADSQAQRAALEAQNAALEQALKQAQAQAAKARELEASYQAAKAEALSAQRARDEAVSASQQQSRAQTDTAQSIASYQAQNASLGQALSLAQAQAAQAKALEIQYQEANAKLQAAQAARDEALAASRVSQEAYQSAQAQSSQQRAALEAENAKLGQALSLAQAQAAKAKALEEQFAQAQSQTQAAQAARDAALAQAQAASAREKELLAKLSRQTQQAELRLAQAQGAQNEAKVEASRVKAQDDARLAQINARYQEAQARALKAEQARDELHSSAQSQQEDKTLALQKAQDELSAERQKIKEIERERSQALEAAKLATQKSQNIVDSATANARSAQESLNALQAQHRDTLQRAQEAEARSKELAVQLAQSQAQSARLGQEAKAASAREAQLQSDLQAQRSEKEALSKAASAREAQLQSDLQAQRSEKEALSKAASAREAQLQSDLQAQRSEKDALSKAASAREAQLLAKISQQETQMQELSEKAAQIGDARRALKGLERERDKALADNKERDAAKDAEIERLSRVVHEGRKAKLELREMEKTVAQLRSKLPSTQPSAPDTAHSAPVQIAKSDSPKKTSTQDLGPGDVQSIRFEEAPDSLRVVIQLRNAAQYESRQVSAQETALTIHNATLPKSLSKKFDTSALQGGVNFVDSYETAQGVQLLAKTGGEISQSIEQNKDGLVWEFKAPRRLNQYAAAIDRRSNVRINASDPSNQADLKLAQNYGKRNTLKGTELAKRRITLDIRDADIHDLLRLLSDEINVSIVASPEVKGNVSLSLKSVPFDQALDIILRTNGLAMRHEGSIIWVANAATFAEEERREMEAATVREKLEPLEVRLIPVNYATAEGIQSNVAPLLSERGSINVDTRTNTLIIKDVAANLNAAEILVNNLDTQTPQVLIEARIVETQANFTKELGVQWGGDGIASASTGNATGIVFPSTIGIAGGSTGDNNGGTSATPNFAVNLPASVGTGSGGAIGMTFGSIGGAINLNIRLSALEEKGFLKIVSSPRVMTLDNIAASIQQGTSIPISVVSAAGTNTVFFDAILSLNVTPHVTRDGNIFLKIKLTKNEPDFGNTGADGNPSILKKEASTELLIPDGDTTVIGGIYTRSTSQSMSSVPFLGSIPFLGYFFRNTSETDNRTELLIFITPRIVNRENSIAASGPGSFIPPAKEGKD